MNACRTEAKILEGPPGRAPEPPAPDAAAAHGMPDRPQPDAAPPGLPDLRQLPGSRNHPHEAPAQPLDRVRSAECGVRSPRPPPRTPGWGAGTPHSALRTP